MNLLQCERHLIKREFTDALHTSTDCFRSLSVPTSESESKIGARALCVAVQALYELGRAEEAFEFVQKLYCKQGAECNPESQESILASLGQSQHVSLDVLKMLYHLRRNLDGNDADRALRLLEPYVERLCTMKASGFGDFVCLDEELAAHYILDHVLPKVDPFRKENLS